METETKQLQEACRAQVELEQEIKQLREAERRALKGWISGERANNFKTGICGCQDYNGYCDGCCVRYDVGIPSGGDYVVSLIFKFQ